MKSRIPKVLHEVCGKPMAGIVAEAAVDAGLSPVVFVVPSDSAAFAERLGSSYTYATQDRQLGTGHALLQAQEVIGNADNVLVLVGDAPLLRSETLKSLAKAHIESETPITILTSKSTSPEGLGRIVRGPSGAVTAIVEEKEADPEILAIDEINSGLYCFQAAWLWDNLQKLEPSTVGEIFLTDLIGLAVEQGHSVETVLVEDGDEAVGVNTRVELSYAETVMRDRIRRHWMMEGVTIVDPSSVYIDYDVSIGIDTVILPNTHIQGKTSIGEACEIGPNSIVVGSDIGSNSQIKASVVEYATFESDVQVGPFSHVREGAYLESDVYLGNYSEVKNSRIGRGSKSGHFSYIGDAKVGTNVNVGAGSITCNFDGENKNVTVIGDDVFIGCDTMMVAPLTIGDRSYTATGSVVNRDVPPDSGAIGAPARIRKKPESDKA